MLITCLRLPLSPPEFKNPNHMIRVFLYLILSIIPSVKKIICLDLKILLSIALGKGIELIPVLVHKNLLQHNTYAQFYF